MSSHTGNSGQVTLRLTILKKMYRSTGASYQEACSDMVFMLGQAGSSQWMFLMQHQFLCCGCNYLNFNKSLQQGNIACVQAVHAGVCACCSE